MPKGGLTAADRAEIAKRAFWSGTITFGLVSIPVNLFAAIRSDRTSLRMVDEEGHPLSRRYFTTRDEKPLEWEDIVRGYEVEKDRFVVLTDEDLERVAPDRTRDIDLRVFVEADSIDPMHFERAYYLTPAGTSTKAYRLLAQVLDDTNRAGIATFVMRAKEYLVAIMAHRGILRAETLRFADEIRTPEYVGLPAPTKPSAAAVQKVRRQIEKESESKFDSSELVDTAAERLDRIVKKKLKTGKEVVDLPEEEQEDARITDLVDLLQRSLNGGTAPRGSATDADLQRKTKTELYERAKKLDVPGRSSMDKDELIGAIRAAAS